jgi:hypothetical protein
MYKRTMLSSGAMHPSAVGTRIAVSVSSEMNSGRTAFSMPLGYLQQTECEISATSYSTAYKASCVVTDISASQFLNSSMSDDENHPSVEPSRKRSGSALHSGPRKKA